MAEKLKPCPFCGAEADVHYFAHDDSECTVMCSNPNCRASVSARSSGSMTTAYNRARKLWNRRAERTCRIIEDMCGLAHCFECGYEFYPYDCSGIPEEGLPYEYDGRYCKNCGARVVVE